MVFLVSLVCLVCFVRPVGEPDKPNKPNKPEKPELLCAVSLSRTGVFFHGDDFDHRRRGSHPRTPSLRSWRGWYEVLEATNGRDGLELYRKKPTDLVITDILMPEVNGLDMLLELTREFLDAKVIAISGLAGERNVLDVAKLLGARQTFQKPFSMPDLVGAVRYELEH